LDALEELANGRLKRHETLLGIDVIPLIIKPDWFKRFLKTVDLYFFVPVGAIPAWPRYGDIDVLDAYGLARSLRRGATTRAQAAQVPQDVIDWVNRWNIGEDDVVHGPMRVVYLERKQMMETFLAFSLAL
jgi:hypothetical protein